MWLAILHDCCSIHIHKMYRAFPLLPIVSSNTVHHLFFINTACKPKQTTVESAFSACIQNKKNNDITYIRPQVQTTYICARVWAQKGTSGTSLHTGILYANFTCVHAQLGAENIWECQETMETLLFTSLRHCVYECTLSFV